MVREFIDLKGLLFLVLITIPEMLSTNIDCGGKPFHCLNTTHFMICVDLGGGVSSTIDDFIIPCPPTTVCEKNNRFECEFPKVEAATADLKVIGVSNVNDKSDDAKTIPPDKRTTDLPLPGKTSMTGLPTKEKSIPTLNIEVLEHLKDEFTGGNEKFFDEDIVPLSYIITTTDKYPQIKINADTSLNEVASASQTNPTLKQNHTLLAAKAINNNNTVIKFNTTTEISQLLDKKLNETLDKFVGETELTTTLPNFSIKRIYTIDMDPGHSLTFHATQSLDSQKKIFKTVPILRNDSDLTIDTFSTSGKVVVSTTKYNGTNIVDNLIVTKSKINNSLTSTTATNYSVDLITENRKDDEYSHIFRSVPVKTIEITTTKVNLNTSGKDFSKLKETTTSTEGLTIKNELNTTNKHDTPNKIDQNNINELKPPSEKFRNKLDSTKSQDFVSVSENLKLQKKIHNPDHMLTTVSEMTTDILSTAESGLLTSPIYNGSDNFDGVIATEAVIMNSLPLKVNSTVSNHIEKAVPEVLKKDGEHKDVFKSVTASPAEVTKSTVYIPVNYDLGTTKSDIMFAEALLITNVNNTSNYSDKHEALQNIVTSNILIKPVTQSILGNLSKNESNNTMQDSGAFALEMTTPDTSINDGNKIEFKGDLEIKNKENASIFIDINNDGINKTKVHFSTETDHIDQLINHNMKSITNLTNIQIPEVNSAFQTTLMNNGQTSTTESQIKRTDEQLISSGHNYLNNLNVSLENKVQSILPQESISYHVSRIEKPKTIASPVINNLTTFGEISTGVESTTTVDYIQQQLNDTVKKYNASIDVEVESSSKLPTITSINANGTNIVTQNTTPISFISQFEAVTEISIVSTKVSQTIKKIENNDSIYKKSGIERTNATDHQLPISRNNCSVNVELSDKFINFTEAKNLEQTENASISMIPNKITKENTFVPSLSNNFSKAEEFNENNTVIKSSNMLLNNKNKVKIINKQLPTLNTTQDNITHFKNFNFNIDEVILEQVTNLNESQNNMNVALPIEQKDDIPMNSSESVTSNIGLHKQNITNIMGTTTQVNGTTRYSLITESVTESIYSTYLSTGTPSSNGLVGSTFTITEYTNDGITLNDSEGNSITSSSSDISPGGLSSTVKSLFYSLKDTHLSPNYETKTSNNNTIASVIDVIKSETGHGRSKLLTLNATIKKLPIITKSRILSNKTIGMIQNANISDNVENQIVSSDITQSTQKTIVNELDSTYSTSTIPTPVAVTLNKQPNIVVDRFFSSTMASNSQYNKDDLVKVEKHIINWNKKNSTEQVAVNNLDSILTAPKPNEATIENESNMTMNRVLSSTMAAINQPNTDGLVKVERPTESFNNSNSIVFRAKKEPNVTVNRILFSTMLPISQPSAEDLGKVVTLNVTQSTRQKVATDTDNISMLSTKNEFIPKNESNIIGDRIFSNTLASISKPNIEESGKDKMLMDNSTMIQSPRQVVDGLDSIRILPSSIESTAKKELNITKVQIPASTTTVITQNELDNFEIPTKNLNIPQSTLQTVSNDLNSKPVLLTTNESTVKKESNIAVNRIVPSIITSVSQLDAHELDKLQIQVENSNVTQTIQETAKRNFHNTSILKMPKEPITENQLNITVSTIYKYNTLPPITQNNSDEVIKFGTQIVNSSITRNTQQIMGTDSNKKIIDIVTEPATIVETVNNTHNVVGRLILSDIIMGNVIFTNETANLKSPNQLNSGMAKETERVTPYENIKKTSLLRNISSNLNNKEDLNIDVVNGTFIDKQINIELSSSTRNNETSAESYELSTVYDKFATQTDVTSPSTPVYNKSENNVGYKSPRSVMEIGSTGYMIKNFSELTQNMTLLNKMKYIYNSTNNSEGTFGMNKTEAKVKNLTLHNILSKHQIEQVNGKESQMGNLNISYAITNQMSNNSNLMTAVHLLGNAKNPSRTINANNVKNNTFPVDCIKLPRGKYADSKDCRKFYICVGKLQPIVGTCPNNTVFSEINKQCTKNLSHCVRNNQFHCLYEGRFSDFLRDNIYYICVKNNVHGFLRYKLQCQNGYHLNKTKVKCEKDEIWNQDTSVSNSSNGGSDQNTSVANSEVSESSLKSELVCEKEGKFPYPKDWRKYYVCSKNSKDEYHQKIISCSSEEIYDRKKKKCVSSDSEES